MRAESFAYIKILKELYDKYAGGFHADSAEALALRHAIQASQENEGLRNELERRNKEIERRDKTIRQLSNRKLKAPEVVG
jgi:hypothetical protein